MQRLLGCHGDFCIIVELSISGDGDQMVIWALVQYQDETEHTELKDELI